MSAFATSCNEPRLKAPFQIGISSIWIPKLMERYTNRIRCIWKRLELVSEDVNVVHLSTRDISGGAARAAYRLHVGLRGIGLDSKMLVAHRDSDDPTVVLFKRPKNPVSRFVKDLRRNRIKRSAKPYRTTRPIGLEPFSDDRTRFGWSVSGQIPPRTILHLHWIATFVDYRAIRAASGKTLGIVWTLHDMNPFTGGCHYDDGCGRWQQECGSCPQLGSNDPSDLSYQVWQRKHAVFEKIKPDNVRLVAPSHWLAQQVMRSSLLQKYSVNVIPYGLDTDRFAPHPKTSARAHFGIPANARAVLFVSDSLSTRRKGMHLLTDILADMCSVPDFLFVLLGSDPPKTDPRVPTLNLNYIRSDQELAAAYSAADVLILPSIEDNLPNTALESLACGTPIIGFRAGGVPDVVRHGVNGLLVPLGDVAGFATAMKNLLLKAERRREMSVNCRHLAVEEYSLEVQARRYLKVYKELVNSDW
jgi:glycosyltransferase involved in cell wall biosynthesis